VEIVKKTLKIILAALFTIFVFFNINGDSNAYAQEAKFTPIMGESQATKEQAIQILKTNNHINNANPKTDTYISDFVNTTWNEAASEGVRADVAFSLMMLETGWLKFGGDVKEHQNNFGGLGATGGGNPGHEFPDIQTGIRAVVQHLKAYASLDDLKSECVDPRFKYVTRGSAVNIEWLGIRENPDGFGWAAGYGYGYKIINIMNQMSGKSVIPVIHNLTVTSSGSTYSITATASYENGALYKFIAINTASEQETLIQDYSQNSTATWTPKSTENYKIKACVKNPKSQYEFDAYTNYNVTVDQVKFPTVIQSFDVGSASFFTGESYKLSANATSANEQLYKFYVRDSSFNWTVLKDYNETNSTTWKPTEPGQFLLVVHVKNSNSSKSYDTFTSRSVTVKETPTVIQSFDVGSTSFFTEGSYTLSASATSANKPLYKFFVRDSNLNWTVLKDYNETNATTWNPTEPGQFLLVVHVKDSYSSKDYDSFTSRSVTVKDTTIESFNVGSGSGFYHGKSYTVSAKAYSANKPLYKFFVRDSSFNWTVLKDYNETKATTWKPTEPGQFLLVVHVKDSNSSKSYDTFTSRSVTVKETPTVIQSFNIGDTTFNTGTNYTLSANATSANKPLYKFFVRDSNLNWTVLKDYNETKATTWNPTEPGQFLLVVHVKDSYSSKDYDSFTSKAVTVKDISTAYKNTHYNITFTEFLNIQISKNPQTDLYGGEWKTAKREDVERYANPQNYLHFAPLNDSDNAKTLQITASSLNVRSRPGTNFGILTSVSKGQIYTIQERSIDWYKITTDIATGWVSGDYVALIGNEQPMPEQDDTIKITASSLRVRSTPVDGETLDLVYSAEN
jgi:N-acetylmuramoyl-L-alanine amidase